MPKGTATKKKVEKQQNVFQGMTLDLTEISKELADRAKRFVFWYCFPGTDCFQHKKRAAIAAGYASRNAATSGYKLCRNPKVIAEIEKLSKSFNAETIDALYRKYINSLEVRAFYDPADFVEDGKFKDLSEIPVEKRQCLDQAVIDSKGGIMGFTFGSRARALTEVKELYEKQHPDVDGGMDVEETKEIIMERVTFRQQKRQRDAAFLAALEAEIIDRPICEIEEEL